MSRFSRNSLIVCVVLGLAACASSNEGTRSNAVARECFSASQVRSFTPIDDTTVRVQTGRRDVYELKLMHFCPNVDWTTQIRLGTGGSSWICTDNARGVSVVVLDRPAPVGPSSCQVNTIRKLDSAELEAEQQAQAELKAIKAARQ